MSRGLSVIAHENPGLQKPPHTNEITTCKSQLVSSPNTGEGKELRYPVHSTQQRRQPQRAVPAYKIETRSLSCTSLKGSGMQPLSKVSRYELVTVVNNRSQGGSVPRRQSAQMCQRAKDGECACAATWRELWRQSGRRRPVALSSAAVQDTAPLCTSRVPVPACPAACRSHPASGGGRRRGEG